MNWRGLRDTVSVMKDGAKLQVHTKVEIKKFAGAVPPEHAENPESHGHELLETVIVENGEEKVFPGKRRRKRKRGAA